MELAPEPETHRGLVHTNKSIDPVLRRASERIRRSDTSHYLTAPFSDVSEQLVAASPW
jgi:hypothetical protein